MVKSIRESMIDTLIKNRNQYSFFVQDVYKIDSESLPSILTEKGIDAWFDVNKKKVLDDLKSFSNEIFCKPFPKDEYFYKNLSFAGIYKSYKPYKNMTKEMNLINGIKKVLFGVNNNFSSYYYKKHKITSNKLVDIGISESVKNASMYGTSYVYDNKCFLHYYDTPLSIFKKDAIKICADRFYNLEAIPSKIIESSFEIFDTFKTPVDIEFIITNSQQIIVTQVRPISLKYQCILKEIDNCVWVKYKNSNINSSVISSSGFLVGNCCDLRFRKVNFHDFKNNKNKIYIVNHTDTKNGTSTLEFINFLSNFDYCDIDLIIHHNEVIVNDHLQYMVFEDTSLRNIFNIHGNYNLIDKTTIEINSDGFNIHIREL